MLDDMFTDEQLDEMMESYTMAVGGMLSKEKICDVLRNMPLLITEVRQLKGVVTEAISTLEDLKAELVPLPDLILERDRLRETLQHIINRQTGLITSRRMKQ